MSRGQLCSKCQLQLPFVFFFPVLNIGENFLFIQAYARFAVAAGGTIGILIPPSLGFILFTILTEHSNGKLFMAGMLPGIMQILFYTAAILAICLKIPALGPRGPKSSMMDKIIH